MIVSWVLFLLAIGSCGTAMALMIEAAGYATHSPHADFGLLERRAVILYFSSGLAFGVGLGALLLAGVISIASRPGARHGNDREVP